MVRPDYFLEKPSYHYLRQLVAEHTEKRTKWTTTTTTTTALRFTERLFNCSVIYWGIISDEMKINQINILVYIFCYVGYGK